MTSKATLALAFGATLMSGTTLMADHANPWATEDDQVLSKYHDANQAKSIGTPGEDEMKGVMTRNAFGKLGGAKGSETARGDAGAGGANNGGGKGGRR